MSLYKTKHLTHPKNLRRKFLKVEILCMSNHISNHYTWTGFTNANNDDFWEYSPQRVHLYAFTGAMRACLKSKGRGRPHIFQKYVSPILERVEECLYEY